VEPTVDVTIAVHTRTRPIARAVASILEHTTIPTRVTVVAHNIDPGLIRDNLGAWAADERVRVLELRDGIPSPAGPMNLGLAESTAPFVAVMGSDDEFEPGAIDSWYALQRSTGAGMVIARVRREGGGKELSPPARPWRSRRLDAVKDRLSYRSAPLGLISRERFGTLRFVEGLRTGEDLPYVTRLGVSDAGIAFARTGPGYLVHDDADDRVTSAPRPIAQDFAFLDHIFGVPDFERFTRAQRTALVVKLIRQQLFDAIVNRAAVGEWPAGEREALAAVARRMLAWADRPERLLSLIDHAVLDGILDAVTPVDDMMALIRRRWNYRSVDVVLTRNPLFALHRQGPLRTYIGGYLV
jgi:hypothetical protein